MKPVHFKGENAVLGPPKNMTAEECLPLPICRTDGGECISQWQGTWRDRIRFLLTGRVWLWVHSGVTQPPVYVGTESPGWIVVPEAGSVSIGDP